jgi:hypothetical protein
MMKLGTTIAMATLLLSWHAPLEAQQQRGDVELRFTGSILSTLGEDATVTHGVFQGKGGYFFTDRVELGAVPTVIFSRTRVQVGGTWQTISDTRFGMGVFGSYSFLAADATTVPYVGAQVYRIDLTDEDETGWAGVNGGIKFYFTRSTAFDVGANYLLNLGDGARALILVQMGLSFLL